MREKLTRAQTLRLACGALAALVAVSLSGCAAGGNSGASSVATPKPISPEEPLETMAEAAQSTTALVLRAETIDLKDAAGAVIVSISYEASASEMVETLTAAIGTPPETRAHDGGLESPPGVYYEWDGLTVSDPEPDPGTFTELSNLSLSVTAPTVGNLQTIATVQGYHVGSDTAPILVENGWSVPEFGMFHFPAEFGTVLGEPSGDNPSYLNAWAVSMSAESPSTTITHIFAPTNFGIQGH